MCDKQKACLSYQLGSKVLLAESLPLLSWYMLGSKVWQAESLPLLSWYMLGSKVL